MIKKLISLALASISTLALAGCGATDSPVMDTTVMGSGSSNKTGLGGYWWTYVDRSGKSSVTPDTGKVDPLNTTTTPAVLKPSIAEGNGIEGGFYHVKGTVGVAPKYNDTTVYDTYWDGFYGSAGTTAPNVCDGACLEMKYPAVGLGFGFKAKNVPLGDDAADKVGIAFKMKITAGEHDIAAAPINVSLPMDLTDAPDPTFGDLFGTQYANIAPTGKAAAGTNTPICTFPGTITGTDAATNKNTVQGSTSKTCFANMTTDGNLKKADGTVTTLPVTDVWQTFCLGWAAFGPPGWAVSGLSAAKPIGVTALEPLKDRIIKMQFDAFKPLDTATAPAKFDFWVDDVILLDDAKWKTECVNAVVFPAGA